MGSIHPGALSVSLPLAIANGAEPASSGTMYQMSTHTTSKRQTKREEQRITGGIDPDDREQLLLDDLRAEVKHLREAIERQNELLATVAADEGGYR